MAYTQQDLNSDVTKLIKEIHELMLQKKHNEAAKKIDSIYTLFKNKLKENKGLSFFATNLLTDSTFQGIFQLAITNNAEKVIERFFIIFSAFHQSGTSFLTSFFCLQIPSAEVGKTFWSLFIQNDKTLDRLITVVLGYKRSSCYDELIVTLINNNKFEKVFKLLEKLIEYERKIPATFLDPKSLLHSLFKKAIVTLCEQKQLRVVRRILDVLSEENKKTVFKLVLVAQSGKTLLDLVAENGTEDDYKKTVSRAPKELNFPETSTPYKQQRQQQSTTQVLLAVDPNAQSLTKITQFCTSVNGGEKLELLMKNIIQQLNQYGQAFLDQIIDRTISALQATTVDQSNVTQKVFSNSAFLVDFYTRLVSLLASNQIKDSNLFYYLLTNLVKKCEKNIMQFQKITPFSIIFFKTICFAWLKKMGIVQQQVADQFTPPKAISLNLILPAIFLHMATQNPKETIEVLYLEIQSVSEENQALLIRSLLSLLNSNDDNNLAKIQILNDFNSKKISDLFDQVFGGLVAALAQTSTQYQNFSVISSSPTKAEPEKPKPEKADVPDNKLESRIKLIKIICKIAPSYAAKELLKCIHLKEVNNQVSLSQIMLSVYNILRNNDDKKPAEEFYFLLKGKIEYNGKAVELFYNQAEKPLRVTSPSSPIMNRALSNSNNANNNNVNAQYNNETSESEYNQEFNDDSSRQYNNNQNT